MELIKTDQEINEAVARKLGWVINKTMDHEPWYWPPRSQPESNGVRKLPDYCRSIVAAWEIVSILGIGFSIEWERDNGWVCTFIKNNLMYVGKADTAPMAICRGFLRVHEFGKDV